MAIYDPAKLLEELCALPRETEYVEFKENNFNKERIGKYISSIANSAMLAGREHGYFVFGVKDASHEVVGTSVRLAEETVGEEEYLHWLNKRLQPAIFVEHQPFDYDGKHVEILKVDPGYKQPVRFNGEAFIRITSSLHPLSHSAEREAAIWATVNRFSFEQLVLETGLGPEDIENRFNVDALINGLKEFPRSPEGRLNVLEQEDCIRRDLQGGYDATNLLGLAAAKDMNQWPTLERKGIRIIIYEGTNKLHAKSDRWGQIGYVASFNNALAFIMEHVNSREQFDGGIREIEYDIPFLAIREVLGNAIVHQDFTITGHGPVVEVYTDRINITNLGKPLVPTERFIDSPSRTRNNKFADLLRRVGICEERGSGIDRALTAIERQGLPAPLFQELDEMTSVTLYGPRPFADMSKEERLRACYQHACLCVELGDPMSNSSLRERFQLSSGQYPQASLVIADAKEEGLIRPLNEGQGNRNARYVPFWY